MKAEEFLGREKDRARTEAILADASKSPVPRLLLGLGLATGALGFLDDRLWYATGGLMFLAVIAEVWKLSRPYDRPFRSEESKPKRVHSALLALILILDAAALYGLVQGVDYVFGRIEAAVKERGF